MTEIEIYPQAEGEPRQQAASAPYMSYKGFKNYLVKFQTEGLPARFDGSYFGNVSGSIVAQVRGTLRYFDLIDDDRMPTLALQAVADASEADIAPMMKAVFEAKYADCLALASNATYDQLADVLRERGLSGATIRKAVTFFIGMADDMGVPYSPHFKKARTSTGNGTARRRAKKAVEPTTPPPPPHQPKQVDNSPEALRAKYINLLMTKVEGAGDGQLDADLLNRIERALGFEEQQAATTEEVGTKDSL
ncbi:MAG: hypothetical protein QM572_05835 [Nocardioides sp.]|uniref:hypothetical protein n=1 Tax=Nocardioides sp. TaxID=35761 RepID=UPI0039E39BAB